MKPQKSLHPEHFYDRHPSAELMTGDIWRGLPTLGLLKHDNCMGIVITPACDLANQKVQTISYLPVIPIADWFKLPDFSSDAASIAIQIIKNLGIDFVSNRQMLLTDCDAILRLEKAILTVKSNLQAKQLPLAERALNALCFIRLVHFPNTVSDLSPASPSDFHSESEWNKLCKALVTNSRSTDIHFLPAESGERHPWSGIIEHSVALFRYPLTVPIRLLQSASDVTLHDWHAAVLEMPGIAGFATAYTSVRPLKVAALRLEFLSDLLTRFTSLYNRLGSPDFSATMIKTLSDNIQQNARSDNAIPGNQPADS